MIADRVARSLLRLGTAGGIVAHHREPGVGLWIEVDGVGRCEFPLAKERIVQLLAHAVPSPFGYRDETRHDTSVRDGWEISGAKVHLDERAWAARFSRGVADIVERLAFPSATKVTPVLQKLLVYEPGQFFARHRDSQKHPGTAGTLVVVLPASHRGGDVVVSHAGHETTVSTAKDASANYLSFFGFYADCVHEVRPVEEGYRVVLTYTLEAEPDDLPGFTGDLGDLKQSLQQFFSEGHPWLVDVLDHQYSEQSLDWSRLKNGDRLRSAALLALADQLGCDCFLALADVHEEYDLISEEEEEDDDGSTRSDDDAYEGMLGALVERELSLTAWIDRRGRPCRGTEECPQRECVVTTIEFDRRTPYEASHEPWTGNEGGSAEKWYRQAALVIIPRATSLHSEVARVDRSRAAGNSRSRTK